MLKRINRFFLFPDRRRDWQLMDIVFFGL